MLRFDRKQQNSTKQLSFIKNNLKTKTRLGADCGSDHEILIVKFRLKWKKVWKTIRPFRYDLNKIPYDYTVGVTNRLKVLNLVDNMPEDLWTEVHNVVYMRQ